MTSLLSSAITLLFILFPVVPGACFFCLSLALCLCLSLKNKNKNLSLYMRCGELAKVVLECFRFLFSFFTCPSHSGGSAASSFSINAVLWLSMVISQLQPHPFSSWQWSSLPPCLHVAWSGLSSLDILVIVVCEYLLWFLLFVFLLFSPLCVCVYGGCNA